MTSVISASELTRRLAVQAQAVCGHYLRAGRKEGRYWIVGDIFGAPGRSLYVRLTGPDSGKGAVGKWTDAATAEHGDLLDLIRLNRGFSSIREAMDEARVFLSLPQPEVPAPSNYRIKPAPHRSSESARRLFAMSKSIGDTLAEAYLRKRGIDPAIADIRALRFHPRCYYRDGDDASLRVFPALIASVTGDAGQITGVHRTWFDPQSPGEKAPVSSPRRAIGSLLGSGVRFGMQSDNPVSIMVVGEGLETIMSLRMIMPAMPMIAALSANHLAAILFPPVLRRLYIAVDADPAGRHGMERLSRRAQGAGIEVLTLVPRRGDFNDDLRCLGPKSSPRAL